MGGGGATKAREGEAQVPQEILINFTIILFLAQSNRPRVLPATLHSPSPSSPRCVWLAGGTGSPATSTLPPTPGHLTQP